jgi:hypothetical protein
VVELGGGGVTAAIGLQVRTWTGGKVGKTGPDFIFLPFLSPRGRVFFFSGLRFSESESVGWIEVYGTSYYGEDAANKSAEWMESHNGEFAGVKTAVDGRSNRNVCTLI